MKSPADTFRQDISYIFNYLVETELWFIWRAPGFSKNILIQAFVDFTWLHIYKRVFCHLTFLISSSSTSRCCLMSSEDEGVWKRWILFERPLLHFKSSANTHPSHHLVKTDQLLLWSRNRHLLVDCWTVESLHEVVRDPSRLKGSQACKSDARRKKCE